MRSSENFGKLNKGILSEPVYVYNHAAVQMTNYKTAMLMAICAAIVCLAFLIGSLFIKSLAHCLWVYATFAVIELALIAYILTYVSINIRLATSTIYLVVFSISLMVIILGTCFDKKSSAAMFIGVIAAIPSQILDKQGRVTAFCVALTVLFCLLAHLFKDSSVAWTDTINATAAMFIGIGMIYYNINTRINSIAGNAKLQWSESRYKAILNDSEDILFEIDTVKKVCYVGEMGKNYFKNDMTYDNFISAKIVYPKDKEIYFSAIRNIMEHGENSRCELRLINWLDEPIWFSFQLVNLLGIDGRKSHIIGRLTNIDAQKRNEEVLKFKSQIDAMTGLYNRDTTETQIVSAIKACEHEGILLLADMDNLKEINDTLGHAAGDESLKRVASTLKRHFGSSGIVGRTGGDEFMVYVCSIDDKSLVDALKALYSDLKTIVITGSAGIRPSLSIGAVPCTDPHLAFNDFYRMADAALYRVKKTNKNCFTFYDPNVDNFKY